MPQEFWRSIQDLLLIFSARPIALPLIILLVIKLYSLNPGTLIYSLGLVVLACLFSMRWCIHLIARHKLAFLTIYSDIKKKEK
jgi:hypothetical protein